MSLPPRGFEPQALEDLGQRSLAELREMLKRQERLLRNVKFICRLPDNGKKILDCVAKLKTAIAEREEVRGRRDLFHPVSLDCKPRQKAVAVDVDVEKAQNSDQILDSSSLVPGCSSVDNIVSSEATSQRQRLAHSTHRGSEEAPEVGDTVNRCPGSSSRASAPSSPKASERLPQHRASGQAEDDSSSSDDLFVDRLQKITIADPGEHHSEENTRTENLTGLCTGTKRNPHYVEVLDMRAKNPVPPAHKFKPNTLPSFRLPSKQNDSSSYQQRSGSPVSSEERRRRDKQHLDDITAARLLPLHHRPAQLLSIEESLALQQQQKKSYEEMQAKLAAQKLAERLNITMRSYNPEGGTASKYREVRDEDDSQSSDGEF